MLKVAIKYYIDQPKMIQQEEESDFDGKNILIEEEMLQQQLYQQQLAGMNLKNN